MTIITKPLSSDKKEDKLVLPLVENDPLATAPPFEDAESQKDILILRAKARRFSTTTTLCLLMTSLVVVSVGIIAGKYLYDQYISAEMRRFRACAQIPMPSEDSQQFYQGGRLANSDLFRALSGDSAEYDDSSNQRDASFDNILKNYFNEEFEIDMDEENYEKIDVPDFRDGRSGRFIHDFNMNITGIIDVTGKRCFVMPLNRGNVLPPRSLFDLIHKMWEGYYKVDTQIIRETMRVVTPPLKDLSEVGTYISKECENRPVYKLEKYVGGVVKRSADLHKEAKFAQYSGVKISEINIVNLDEVKSFEEENNIH